MKKNNPLYLNDDDWDILQGILKQYPGTFYAYGSRVKGEHTVFSDIDLCVAGPIDMLALKEAFYESNLPFKVDVKQLEDFSPDFLQLIEKDFVRL